MCIYIYTHIQICVCVRISIETLVIPLSPPGVASFQDRPPEMLMKRVSIVSPNEPEASNVGFFRVLGLCSFRVLMVI